MSNNKLHKCYVADEDSCLDERGMESVSMETANLSRHRDTLQQQGKNAKAAELDCESHIGLHNFENQLLIGS